MANKKKNQFITKKSHDNVTFLVFSIMLVVILGFLVSNTVTFFIKNADLILVDNKGELKNMKSFNMKAFEDLKAKRPLNQ